MYTCYGAVKGASWSGRWRWPMEVASEVDAANNTWRAYMALDVGQDTA